jgi:pimeloyl-ACP methyl ester carboxylesterase
MVPELQQEYRVTTYDLRGHGRSDAPPAGYTTGDMAQDLRGIMDALAIDRAALVGHSWGADIVLHFALMDPDRVSQIVLIEGALLAPLASAYRDRDWDGWPYVTGTIEELVGRPIPEESRYDLDYLLRQLIEIPILYGPARGMARDEEIVLRVLDVLRPMWEGREADGNMGVESLSRIEHPALLIYEANSVFMEAYRALSGKLPNATSAILPPGKLKHFASLEHPERILAHTRSFLARESAGVIAARAIG